MVVDDRVGDAGDVEVVDSVGTEQRYEVQLDKVRVVDCDEADPVGGRERVATLGLELPAEKCLVSAVIPRS